MSAPRRHGRFLPALLLLELGRPVTVDRLIGLLWFARQPADARTGYGSVTAWHDLRMSISQADEVRLRAVAVPWAETEELAGTEPEVLAEALSALAALARSASSHGDKIYCLLSL